MIRTPCAVLRGTAQRISTHSLNTRATGSQSQPSATSIISPFSSSSDIGPADQSPTTYHLSAFVHSHPEYIDGSSLVHLRNGEAYYQKDNPLAKKAELAELQCDNKDEEPQLTPGIPSRFEYSKADADQTLLARVFNGLPHLPCTSSQSQADIKDLLEGLSLFYSDIECLILRNTHNPGCNINGHAEAALASYSPGLWDPLSVSDLKGFSSALSLLTDSGTTTWMPKYGCALLAIPADDGTSLEMKHWISRESGRQAQSDTATVDNQDGASQQWLADDKLSLVLVGLDDWSFKIHSFQPPGAGQHQMEHSAECGDHSVMVVGAISRAELPVFRSKAVNTQAVNTQAVNTQAVNTQAVNIQAVSTQAVSTQAVNTQAVSTQAVSTQAVNTQAVNTQAVSTQAVNTQAAVSTQAVSTQAVSTQAVSTQAVRHTGSQHTGSQHTGSQHTGSQHTGSQHTGSQHTGSQHTGSQHTGSQHTGSQHTGSQHTGSQHTGSQHRDTCWPLVREVLKVCLRQWQPGFSLRPADVHSIIITSFELWLLQRQVQLAVSSTQYTAAAPTQLSTCMVMLRSAAIKAACLNDQGHDMASFERAAEAAKQSLMSAASARAQLSSRNFQLESDLVSMALSTQRLPESVLPPHVLIAQDSTAGLLSEARRRAVENLGSYPMCYRVNTTVSSASHTTHSRMRLIHSILKQPEWCSRPNDPVMAPLALHVVERELFSIASQGTTGFVTEVRNMTGHEIAEMEALESLVDDYRQRVHSFLSTPAGGTTMRVEMLSREVLVVWVMYCLADAAARQLHGSSMERYGVSASWEDLRHLVLSDRQATDAALGVAQYLHAHTKPGKELFSLANGGAPTFQMAAEFASGDAMLTGIWKSEQTAADHRKAAHWAEVQRKQKLAAALRLELAVLISHMGKSCQLMGDAQQELHAQRALYSYKESYMWSSQQAAYNKAYQNHQNARHQVSSKEAEVRSAEAAPPPVMQPVPKEKNKALSWLFFYHMPKAFRILSRFSFMSQQMLLPPPSEPEHAALWDNTIRVESYCKTMATDIYNNLSSIYTYVPHNSLSHVTGFDGFVQLQSRDSIPKKYGPDHVDSFTSPEDGVWYPDNLDSAMRPEMTWYGSGCLVETRLGFVSAGCFNPFAELGAKVTEQLFTEKLTIAPNLQWTMHVGKSVNSCSDDRGNQGIANQKDRPCWLTTKPSFLTYTSLRSYPTGQLRRLCEALHLGELPLSHPGVIVLVRQLLFHIGTLHLIPSQQRPGLLWRTDWEVEGDVLPTLCCELERLASDLDPAPRDHDAVLLLGEIAAYLSLWHQPCVAVTRHFAAMTSRAADEMEETIVAAAPEPAVQQQLQARQCHLRMLSLLCFGAGALRSDQDIADSVRLTVLIKHGKTFLDSLTGEQASSMQAMYIQCMNVMARRSVDTILSLTPPSDEVAPPSNDPLYVSKGHMLTAAISSVLQRTPATLRWYCISVNGNMSNLVLTHSPSCSYEAVGDDGHLYSINVLDGTVLLDGKPPGRLPRNVLEHPLYKRTFGDHNFEVSTNSSGVHQTIKPVKSRLYDFYLASDSSSSGSKRLVITEIDQGFSKGKGVILLRPRDFQQHQCSFLIQVLATDVIPPSSTLVTSLSELPSSSSTPPDTVQQAQTKLASTVAGPQLLKCWRVPSHLQRLDDWTQLLSLTSTELIDHLVLPSMADSQVLRVLSKLEDPSLIHTYRSTTTPSVETASVETASDGTGLLRRKSADQNQGSQVLIWELPRYSIEFEQHGGVLHSRDHSGYKLAVCQQLVDVGHDDSIIITVRQEGKEDVGNKEISNDVGKEVSNADTCSESTSLRPDYRLCWYTLPDFQQYLVLERGPELSSHSTSCARRADTMILVPHGIVQRRQSQENLARSTSAKGNLSEATAEDLDVPEGLVGIALERNCDATLHLHCYTLNQRFGNLRASSRLSRLQLAALYAATSTLLPEPLSKMTGAQMAMQLVRQCWSNRPLTARESEQLITVGELGGHLAAGLNLLVHELQNSATQLIHLYPDVAATTPATTSALHAVSARSIADHTTAYCQAMANEVYAGWCYNPHAMLTEGEVQRVMPGFVPSSVHSPPEAVRRKKHRVLEVSDLPLDLEVVEKLEQEIKTCYISTSACHHGSNSSNQTSESPPVLHNQYPLSYSRTCLPLERAMHDELKASWDEHVELNEVILSISPEELTKRLNLWKVTATKGRQSMEVYLLTNLCRTPATSQLSLHQSRSFRMLRLSGMATWPNLQDLAKIALKEGYVEVLNPFLTPGACKTIVSGVRLWLKLCVLEDKLDRLRALMEAGEEFKPTLVKELQVERIWRPDLYPEWLVFEAEGQLQIRPAQYNIAQYLMNHPGSIAQLNMGEGKTSVILPMLALHWSKGRGTVVRLNLLSTLMEQSYSLLANSLCASLLDRKIFVLPFHRNVEVTESGARAMLSSLNYCKKEGGVLLVAPEHRLSFQLKHHEMRLAHEKQKSDMVTAETKGPDDNLLLKMLDVLQRFPYVDILDESDELLHHRFQLVYAHGSATLLPAVIDRAVVAQALLRIISDNVESWLDKRSAVWESNRNSGAFKSIRLLSGVALQEKASILKQQLADSLLQSPPYELRWLRQHPQKVGIMAAMLDESTDALAHLNVGGSGMSDDQRDQVLAVRGMLCVALLMHGLQKRHGVDYGVNRSPHALKQLAVPFRAADTPSERSEFAQPDVALLLTTLSYYHTGLTQDEMNQAVDFLLHCLGPSAQSSHYQEWYKLAEPGMDAETRESLNNVSKVDPSNAQQVELMFHHYSNNMALIDFWLNKCIFPTQTQQFPQRLAANSWHLASTSGGRTVVGFSGTNDNHRLLPLQVKQAFDLPEPSLMATNGKMLSVIIKDTVKGGFTTIKVDDHSKPSWKALLDQAILLKVHAILDCGAMLAGASNKEAAEYVLGCLDTAQHRGVCYYDSSHKCWMIQDNKGRCLPRHASPVHESQAFVIYDDARCRGADLQLRPMAVGLLTLGPGTCKDKMMQAAGRLRMLGRGQKLHFAAPADVTAKIRKFATSTDGDLGSPADNPASFRDWGSEEPDPPQVLRWVMNNTVQATLNGVVEWAKQGLFYVSTYEKPENVVEDEVLDVATLYQSSRAAVPVASLIESMSKNRKLQDALSSGSGEIREIVKYRSKLTKKILKGSKIHGMGHEVLSGCTADEEIERELEKEEEQEEEVEKELERMRPAREADWDLLSVFGASATTELDVKAAVKPLSEMIQELHSREVKSLAWSTAAAKVLCTSNFRSTILAGVKDEYLRQVRAMLWFRSGEALLISEREADALLELKWKGAGSNNTLPLKSMKQPGPVLLTLSYAQQCYEAGVAATHSRSPAGASGMPALACELSFMTAGVSLTSGQLHIVNKIPDERSLVSTRLFDGSTTYMSNCDHGERGTNRQLTVLHQMMRRKLLAAEELTGLRGKRGKLLRSDLELACGDTLPGITTAGTSGATLV
ncbi:hypothetical protein CEUSTIGMA_g524.t1 [Chlamydomonas eustigma]|uniref:ubiquitinyl hydrolase 1 n=1 Tax=Chlamydomonas eustigma TaxID=1157962 RepID=A0A250WQJ5_9CHLO|nr:hypothetical protein CEUSTIGMA_g524.t1 [Chlamydomonas eustigma]|eukprot:GAX73071.1 hypothetical protein CEUSTIGMA_g524.t1 [Chlamydomonas eustigma]